MGAELERGHLFFCYRPRVDVQRATGLLDVQRFYMIMKPDGKRLFRRIIMGRKRLPDLAAHEREWAFVDRVSPDPVELEDELDPRSYRTRTRGPRVAAPARPAGESVYMIARHATHTHLAYVLELPNSPGPVQRDLRITDEASFVVTVRNPDADPGPRAGLPPARRPDYPETLSAEFTGRRFIELDPPEFLDYPGTEIVLVGATHDAERELGVRLRPQHRTPDSAAFFSELGMERDVHPLAPLTSGEWE
ncbi:hypothetical protein ACVGVM_18860 [Pseudonocardia bannensis]|uniref:Uncharacterized protein n=1 Tax=Pseudonocardia bannensis TaxID=630973 RepID=A0A848DIM9_9PSEU|nr:hypothetical protein [Pseudonocardia bannensis]NMH92425.1 hypothetical protein [Pseudonocardia bannensis]